MTNPGIRLPRALLSGAFFVTYGLFALPFGLLLPILPRAVGRWGVRIFYKLFVFFARITGLYTVRSPTYRARPRARVPGRIVVMNHVSLIDICILLAHLPDAVCIAKAAAKRNPVLSLYVRKLFIANDKGAAETLAEAAAYLKRGVQVVIFPQGTRGGTKWQRGAARLALATGAEIRCFHIAYDPVVLAKNQPWWDVGDKIIRIVLEDRGTLLPEGANDHRAAVALTERLRATVLGKREDERAK